LFDFEVYEFFIVDLKGTDSKIFTQKDHVICTFTRQACTEI